MHAADDANDVAKLEASEQATSGRGWEAAFRDAVVIGVSSDIGRWFWHSPHAEAVGFAVGLLLTLVFPPRPTVKQVLGALVMACGLLVLEWRYSHFMSEPLTSWFHRGPG